MEDFTFSYATPDDPPFRRLVIRLVERVSGQPALKRLYLDNRACPCPGESFWAATIRSLALDVRYDAAALARIPKTGPVVFVANHPYGVLDGIIICWLVEKIRSDFVVLTHSALMRAPELREAVLPIDFSRNSGACATNLATRAAARSQLERGGAVIVFPAGMISTAPHPLGRRPAVDARWQPFAAQLIQRAQATVVPIFFGGQNGRLFQLASHVSATLRLALIFHEVKARIGSRLDVAIGAPIGFDALSALKDRQALADDLRARTYALALGEGAYRRGLAAGASANSGRRPNGRAIETEPSRSA